MSVLDRIVQAIDKRSLWEKEISLNRNQFLKIEGSRDTNVYYVLEGSLRMFVVDEFEEHTIRLGYKGNIVTALDAFISGQPSDLNIQALKYSRLQMIPKTSFVELMRSSTEMLELWLELLEGFVMQQMERERDLLTSSPLERYRRVLQRSPHIFQEIPNKYIASYLRMTPETLSRIKKS